MQSVRGPGSGFYSDIALGISVPDMTAQLPPEHPPHRPAHRQPSERRRLNCSPSAGYRITIQERSVFPRIDDPQISAVLFRAQEISRYVVDGIIDCGLTGPRLDRRERQRRATSSRSASWNTRARSRNPPRGCWRCRTRVRCGSREDLDGKIVATELVNTTQKYFAEQGVKVTVEFSWGTTEIKARLLDAHRRTAPRPARRIRANNLRVVDTLLKSTTALRRQPRLRGRCRGSARRWKTSPCSCAARSRRGRRSA